MRVQLTAILCGLFLAFGNGQGRVLATDTSLVEKALPGADAPTAEEATPAANAPTAEPSAEAKEAPISLNASPEEVMVRVEKELEKIQVVENGAANNEEAMNACRTKLKEAITSCKGNASCEDYAFREFRVCAAKTLEVTKVALIEERVRKALQIVDTAQNEDHCLMIVNLRKECKEDEDCLSRLWSVYQDCNTKIRTLTQGNTPVQKSLTKDEKEILEEQNKALDSEDTKAQSELMRKLLLAAQQEEVANTAKIAEEKRRLEDEIKAVEARKLALQQSLQEAKIPPAPTPVTAITAPLNKSAPFADAPFNDCQVTFINEVRTCQKTYTLNPVPRFDNTYVSCVQEAFGRMQECYGTRNLGQVQIPSTVEILTEFGEPIRNSGQCYEVIVGKAGAKCGRNWDCRQEAQSKAQMCGPIVSLATAP